MIQIKKKDGYLERENNYLPTNWIVCSDIVCSVWKFALELKLTMNEMTGWILREWKDVIGLGGIKMFVVVSFFLLPPYCSNFHYLFWQYTIVIECAFESVYFFWVLIVVIVPKAMIYLKFVLLTFCILIFKLHKITLYLILTSKYGFHHQKVHVRRWSRHSAFFKNIFLHFMFFFWPKWKL